MTDTLEKGIMKTPYNTGHMGKLAGNIFATAPAPETVG